MGGPQFDRNFGGYRVFCGDLGSRTSKYDLEKEFDAFGALVDCWVARNPPGFAFIVYKHAEDAERAVEELDGRTICGRRVRVEHARPTGSKKGGGPSSNRGSLRQRSPGQKSPERRSGRREKRRSPSRSRSHSSPREERRRHRRSGSHSKKESKRKRRSSSTEKKRSRETSRSPPAEAAAANHSDGEADRKQSSPAIVEKQSIQDDNDD